MATPTAINPDIHRVRDEAADILIESINRCSCADCRGVKADLGPDITRAVDPEDEEDEGDEAEQISAHETRDQAAKLLLRSINACEDPDCTECVALRTQYAALFRAEDEDDEDQEDDETPEDEEEEEEEEPPPPPAKKAPAKAKAKAKRSDEPDITRSASVVEFANPVRDTSVFVPLTRIDTEQREIEGVLSNEDVDTFGTVFDHEAMKRAVQTKWHGNVREQHDPKKAVGRGVRAIFDDDKKQTIIRARISKGAEDTWQKILDGTLSGFSIGASNPKTETRMINNKPVPTYVDFNLAEVSVVDAPSNPGAAKSGLTIYRAAVADTAEMFSDALDASEEAPVAHTPLATPSPVVASTPFPMESAPMRHPAIAAGIALNRAELPEATNMTAVSPGTDNLAPNSGDNSTKTGASLDHADYAAIDAAMNQEHGAFAHAHVHPYEPGHTHVNNHGHAHADGSSHPHPHMHTHVGAGNGEKPHVHLHEHGHEYRTQASDLVRNEDGAVMARFGTFLGEDQQEAIQTLCVERGIAYPGALPASTPTPTPTPLTVVDLQPAALPVETSGISAPIQRATIQTVATPATERVGMRISGDTKLGLHEATLSILRTCGCPVCQEAILCYDPDNDGDDDVDEGGDDDDDAMPMGRAQHAKLTRAVKTLITTQLQQQTQPILAQFRAVAARLATVQTHGVQTPDLTRMQGQLDEVRAVLTAVQGLVAQIAEAEAPGGPVVRAMDRTLPLDNRVAAQNTPFSHDQLQWLRQQNLINPPTADQQTALAELAIRRQLGQP